MRASYSVRQHVSLCCVLLAVAVLPVVSASAQSSIGKTTIVGPDDPLLLINHTGSTSNPALWFEQDGTPKAYMWWDQTSNCLNLGTSTVNPILTVDDNGNVGIGTTNPTSRLEIAGQDGLAISGYQPFLTLRDLNASPPNGMRAIMASGNGDFGFYPESFLSGYPAVVIKNSTGNFGIGVPSPTRKLEVAGAIRSTTGGFVFPDGTTQTTAELRGATGPQGPAGPAGPPGPPSHTVAVCREWTNNQSGICSCFGRTVVYANGPCQVTSDTGSCSASADPVFPVTTHGSCCVCAP